MFHEAFKRLAGDPEVRPGLEVLFTSQWLAKERDVIEALEAEIARIDGLLATEESQWRVPLIMSPSPGARTLSDRRQLLLRELAVSQGKCQKWEARKATALLASSKVASQRR